MEVKRTQKRNAAGLSAAQLAALTKLHRSLSEEKPSVAETFGEDWEARTLPMAEFVELRQFMRRLRGQREKAKMTLEQMAAATGIQKPNLSALENGKTPNPTVATLSRMAGALGYELALNLRKRKPAK